MEEWVRVQNERDRKVLTGLRGRVGDTAIVTAARACAHGDSKPVCQRLGRSAPILPNRIVITEAVGEKHLAVMYAILCARPADVQPGR